MSDTQQVFGEAANRAADTLAGVHNMDVETDVLGAVLVTRGEALRTIRAREMLLPTMFFGTHHELIYEAMLHLFDAGREVTEIAVCDYLAEEYGRLEDAGGASYVNSLPGRITERFGERPVEEWAEFIRLCSEAREMGDSFINDISAAEVADRRRSAGPKLTLLQGGAEGAPHDV